MADTSRFHCFISHSNTLAPAASTALEPLAGHSTGNSKMPIWQGVGSAEHAKDIG
ncbi:hypothetical protein BDP67DRAFT_580453 [Colletotrichum lupini]|nr:hypothetical protein BDP67DRAFT_580453 [Colletotrichum lupini]